MIFNDSCFPGSSSAHFNFRLRPDAQKKMKPCPFCAHKDARLENTHTPSYWVECGSCGANIHDPRSARGTGERSHRASAMRAIKAWNSQVAG
jgi:hypothetical protein